MYSEKGKIFIMDDDPLLVDMYTTAFKVSGYEVESSFDGEEGLKKIKEMPVKPSVILSDIMMPKMHGLDFLSKLKEDKELKKIPVVFLTNLSGMDDVKRGLELGAVTYIVKSRYTPKEVVGKLKEILAGYDRDNIPEVQTVIKQ